MRAKERGSRRNLRTNPLRTSTGCLRHYRRSTSDCVYRGITYIFIYEHWSQFIYIIYNILIYILYVYKCECVCDIILSLRAGNALTSYIHIIFWVPIYSAADEIASLAVSELLRPTLRAKDQ